MHDEPWRVAMNRLVVEAIRRRDPDVETPASTWWVAD